MNKIDELVILSKKGDLEAKEELILSLQPLILSSIKKYYYGSLDFDDLIQEGRLRLLQEIIKFDTHRGIPFLGYIKLHMKYLYLELSRRKKEILTLNSVIEDGIEAIELIKDELDIEKDYLKNETNKELYEGFSNLTSKQKEVLNLVYMRGMTMRKISSEMNLHYQTVVGIKERGIKKLREQLK